jgi:eukaryotic-like serine/threonine-protein kinase
MNVTRERWQQIARLYELAVECDPAARDSLLSEACAHDPSLIGEVQSLLNQQSSPNLLDQPAWAAAAPLFLSESELASGAVLGPYRIDAPLGAGGMGEVFSATDTRLNRRVAIKVLPPGIASDPHVRARFSREAEAVAALTHPNICTLYDVGSHDQVDYLVMEYLEGDTLAARLTDGPLPSDLALTYAKEVASALEHAHRHGIVHRDLKPANIMLTAGGAKLLDFGLAKIRSTVGETADVNRASTDAVPLASADAADPGDAGPLHLTRGGAVLGTVRYMAPEQIDGHQVDARSDLFSFGTVLHEMFTGRRAFDGDSVATIRRAILGHEPASPSTLRPALPAAIDDIVRRCLAKDRDQRWQSAGDLRRALEQVSSADGAPHTKATRRWAAATALTAIAGLAAWLLTGGSERQSATTPLREIRSIAVLPLEDLSGDPDQAYLSDGMTEQLTSDLASISGLRVISRTSMMRYRADPKPVRQIARELNVDGIIEGSVVRASDRVRITARLIRGATGEVLWAQSFERGVRDVLALQRDVARAIGLRVDVTLTPQEQAHLAGARPVDPDAHRQVLLGRHHAAKATEEGLRKAVEHFDRALAATPDNALAHAGLAETYIGLSGYYMRPKEAMPRAKQAAETALRLDESLADAHAALGYVHLVYDWDGPAARTELLRALELDPTLAVARLHYAAYLTTQAQHEQAVAEIRRAIGFDPVSLRSNALATSLLLFARRYDDAIELARRGFEVEPNAFALAFQGVAYAEQRRFPEAVDAMDRAARLDSSGTILALQAHVLASAGKKADARRVIRRVEESAKGRYFCPYEIGTAHVSLGDDDTAYRWFRLGVEDRADCMAWLGVEPWVERFRADPRYATLLRDIGLDPSAQ